MKLRVEVDEMGRTIIILPDDLVEEFSLEHGDALGVDFPEDDLMIIEF